MPWRRQQTSGLINNSQVHELVAEIVAPDIPHFALLSRSLYARPIDADITLVLKLDEWKGAAHSFSSGVSLSYVPDRLSMPLRFHRTLKSARRDLWIDHFSEFFPEEAYVTRLRGEKVARSGIERAWNWARPRAVDWWASAATLDGVLNHADSQVEDERGVNRLSVTHSPGPWLIQVLTLARLGRLPDVHPLRDAAAKGLESAEREALEAAIARAAPAT
jgi:hypothetical protein